MAPSYPYETQKGRRWEARYRKPDGKTARKAGFLRKRDADDYLTTVEASKLAGEYVAPSDAKITVSQLGPSWLAAHKTNVKPSTYRVSETSWRVHVEPKWGNRAIGSIRHSEVKGWVAALATEKSPTIVWRAHGVLAAILDDAVRDRRINKNPARDVKLPRKVKKANTYLTHAQVETLAATAKHPDLVRFLAYTGLRWGEATALRVRDVDSAARRCHVVQNAVLTGSQIIVGTPKTHERRSVGYPAFLDDALAQAVAGKGPDDLVWGEGKTHLRTGSTETGWLAMAVRRAQKADKAFPRVTAHDLRHTAASLAIASGANVKSVQRMLGHASAAMTLDVYADLFEEDVEAVANALDAARARALSGNAAVTELLQGDVGKCDQA